MNDISVQASVLSGVITAPPSKSHTLRAILLASLACGESRIRHYLHSPDTQAMIAACRQLGAEITETVDELLVQGVSGKPQLPDDVVQAGNSGQVLRFVTAMAALCPGYTVLTGDHSIRHNRPMQPLIEGLRGLGAFCVSSKDDGHAPIVVRGVVQPGSMTLSGEDSQPVSALLMMAAFLPGITEIYVENPGEKPWIDVTLDWMARCGIQYERRDYDYYKVFGHAHYNGFEYTVPGDMSSVLFPVVAAVVTRSEISIKQVNMQDIQGDKQVLHVLQKMGAHFEYDAEKHVLHVRRVERLIGCIIDCNDFVDAIPILAVVGCYAEGETKIVGAKIAREKECDRIAVMARELRKMGADISELPDGLCIRQSDLRGAVVHSHQDHRVAMSLMVAGLMASGVATVEDVACVAKSYAGFVQDIQQLGGRFA